MMEECVDGWMGGWVVQMDGQQWRSYTRAHTGLGPGKSFEVNVPEPSGVARNGPSRARPDHSKIYSINNSSLFQVASYTV